MITAAMKRMLADLSQHYGGMPESYVVIDTETLGFHHLDMIWGLGAQVVQNREIAQSLDLVLNWTDHKLVDPNWLEKRISSTREAMRAGGRNCHLTLEVLQQGVVPEVGLEQFGQLLLEARENRWPILGHGIIKFDCPRISAQLEEWIGLIYKFRPSEVIDTSAIEKASEAGLLPKPGESFFNFSKRVIHARIPGLRYNLDRCFEKYGLAAKIDAKELHSAGGDTLICYHLYEEYRRLSGV